MYDISLNFDGQALDINHETKTCKTYIDTPFFTAGKQLNWPKKEPGIGLNDKIIDYVLDHKYKLKVKIHGTGQTYYILPDKLQEFINNHKTAYPLRNGKVIKVISWKWFTNVLQT